MKLYLSSYRIPNPQNLLKLLGSSPKSIAIIPNAKDYYSPRARAVKMDEAQTFLQILGGKTGVVDLNEYSNGQQLLQKLQTFDMLWVVGGNTFCLRDAMQSSGFDTIITELLNNGTIYAGESAGACVIGNSLTGLEAADNPAFTENVIWEGLALVDSFILPHVDNTLFAEDIMFARQAHSGEQTIELKDSQALIIDGEKQFIV